MIAPGAITSSGASRAADPCAGGRPGPGTDGIEATRRIAGLRAGASGFLVEGAEPRELVDAIRIVAPGSSVVAPRVVRRMLDLFATPLPAGGGDRGDLDPRLRSLTPRELDVLRCIAEGLSNTEIAERSVLSPTAVTTRVGDVLAELGLGDRVQAVIAADESGLAGSGGSGGPRP